MATLKEVAKLAGVDPSVVSRVINNDKSLNIKSDTRHRIIEAINKLNYRPNIAARNLKKGETKTLGMVIPDFSNPVYASIIHGAEDQASQQGYNLLVYSMKQKGLEQSYISPLYEGRIDGLLIASLDFNDTEALELEKQGLPFVLVNRLLSGVNNYVVADDVSGAKLAVKHLIELGHKRIAHIAGPLFTGTGLNRLHGYRAALQEMNIEFISNYVQESTYTVDSGYQSMNVLLDLSEPPTAVFASNIMVCLGAIKAIQDRKLSIPQDISIIGFHDVFFTSILQPPLSTVKMPLYEMGEEAVKKLINMLQGKDKGQSVTVPGASLVIRKSTAPLHHR